MAGFLVGLGGDRRLNLHEAVGIVILMKWLSFAKRPNILKCLEMTGHINAWMMKISSRFPLKTRWEILHLGFHGRLTMRQSTCIGRSWSLTFFSGLHSRELKKRQRLFMEILSCGKSTTYSIKSCTSFFSNPITDPWDDSIFTTKTQQKNGSVNIPSSHGSVMGMWNFYPHCFIFYYI